MRDASVLPKVRIDKHPTEGWIRWRCDCGIGGHGFDSRGAAMRDAAEHSTTHAKEADRG